MDRGTYAIAGYSTQFDDRKTRNSAIQSLRMSMRTREHRRDANACYFGAGFTSGRLFLLEIWSQNGKVRLRAEKSELCSMTEVGLCSAKPRPMQLVSLAAGMLVDPCKSWSKII